MSSSPPSPPPYQAVATLEYENSATTPPMRAYYYIFPGQTLKFGRDSQSNDFVLDDTTVSRNHLDFYSIMIDEKAEPVLYVRDRQTANGTFVNDILIDQGSGVTPGRLLEHGDIVSGGTVWHFSVKLLKMNRMLLSDVQMTEAKYFSNQYTISDIVLGSGISTTVRLSHDVETGKQLACKLYDLRERRKKNLREEIVEVTRAVNLSKHLQHPNVTTLKCAYQSQHTLFVFEELAAGGDLFSLVCGSTRLSEVEIRWIIRQLLSGLKYLHAKRVAHRDIKLENVLLCVCPKPAHRMALTDFGHARVVPEAGSIHGTAGTPGWQAPELVNPDKSHGLPVDMWSMGVMAVQLLLGNAASKTMTDLEETLRINPNLKTLNFKSIFNEIYQARYESASNGNPREDFIRRCLECDPNKRMTVNDALKHPYINEPAADRERFEQATKQTTARWTRRVGQVEIQRLPEVLAPPSSAPVKAPTKKVKLKINMAGRKGAMKNDNGTTKSPYFKVTKAIEVKRPRSDEFDEEFDNVTKRRKLSVDVK